MPSSGCNGERVTNFEFLPYDPYASQNNRKSNGFSTKVSTIFVSI